MEIYSLPEHQLNCRRFFRFTEMGNIFQNGNRTFVIYKDIAIKSLLENVDVLLVEEVDVGGTECISVQCWISFDKP